MSKLKNSKQHNCSRSVSQCPHCMCPSKLVAEESSCAWPSLDTDCCWSPSVLLCPGHRQQSQELVLSRTQ